jgi:protein arginine N-methyltransferase 1
MNAIQNNPQTFSNKCVLDVGCGTGILSVFCVRAGAEKVIAVDLASVAEYAKHICRPYRQIDVLRIDLKDLKIPEKSVDIIVSEWMGYCLLYESMIYQVIETRDRFLKPNGLIFPDTVKMFVCGLKDSKGQKNEKQKFWKNVYGLDMSCLGNNFLAEPIVDYVDSEDLVTDVCNFVQLDLMTCRKEDCEFANNYELTMQCDGKIDSLVVWFDVGFNRGL